MDRVLILTPMKDAARYLDRYLQGLSRLTYPRDRLSLGILAGDHRDDTNDRLQEMMPALQRAVPDVRLFHRDFGFRIPPGVPRWAPEFQLARRTTLARVRNHLLFSALRDEAWVLWLDVDVVSYPADIIEVLTGYNLDILHPNCVLKPGGANFDRNAWARDGTVCMDDLRGAGGPARIDSVGGTVLLIRADRHRDGLVFPCYRYGLPSPAIRSRHPVWGSGEIETEGLAAMARDMSLQCWGLPDYEVIHAAD